MKNKRQFIDKLAIGDIVTIRLWEDIEKEFGLDYDGDIIAGNKLFMDNMTQYCSKSYEVLYIYPHDRSFILKDTKTDRAFSNGMIEPYIYRDGEKYYLRSLYEKRINAKYESYESAINRLNEIKNNTNMEDNFMKHLVTGFNEIVPNKVYEIYFDEDHNAKEKVVCDKDDTFSLEAAITIAIAKHFMGGTKAYNNELRHALKVYDKQKSDEIAAQIEREKKAERDKKNRERKERRKARRREEQINIQKEAYKRAMEEMIMEEEIVVESTNADMKFV